MALQSSRAKNQLIDTIVSSLRSPKLWIGVALVLAWQALAMYFPPGVFPGIAELIENLVVIFSGAGLYDPMTHIPITVARILIGFSLVMVFGVLVGMAIGVSRAVERSVLPYVLLLIAFPGLIWAFLALSWFGITTYLVPVMTIFFTVIPFVIVNVWEGTNDIDKGLIDMADSFEASSLLKMRHIYVPHLMPYIFASFRIALAISWKIVLVAEIFGVQEGVGFVINSYFIRLRADMVIAWALPVMAIIFLIDTGLRRAEKRSFEWRSEVEKGTMR